MIFLLNLHRTRNPIQVSPDKDSLKSCSFNLVNFYFPGYHSLLGLWTVLSPSTLCICFLVIYKTIQPYISGLTSGLSSASLVYMSIFKPVTYCFGYHSFVICFTIRKCVRPRAFFFCLKIFWLLKVLWDGIWILGWFSISAKEKKGLWNFDGNCNDSVDHFG